MDSSRQRDNALRTTLGAMGLVSLGGVGSAHAEVPGPDADKDGKDSSTVVVTAEHPTLDVLPEKILDIPQSINVVGAELLRKQGGTALVDALKNVPGITLNAGEGGTHGDLVNLRGFSAGDDYFMDGLRDTGLYDRDAFDYDAVEVYKGPASTLFGRGSTGGVINQVMKTPQLKPIYQFAATAGTNSEARATADMDFPFAASSAARLNVMGQKSEVEGRPFTRTQRWGVAPALAFGIDTDTTGSLKYLHQEEDNIPDYGIPFLFDRPAPVARDTYYGLPSDDRFKTRVDVVTGRLEHIFGDVWTVSDTARYGNYYFLSRQTAAIYGSGNCFASTSAAGYFTGAPLCSGAKGQTAVAANNPFFPVAGTPLYAIDVLRDRPSANGTIKTAMDNLDVTARFATGAIKHTMIFGAEYDDERADLTRFVNQDTVITPVPLLAPDPFEAFPGTQTTVNQKPQTRTHTTGVYANDTLTLAEQWQFTGAIRYDRFNARFDQPLGNATHFEHTDTIWSPRGALVYKPAAQTSVYFSYGTSFNPSAENLALSASNQALPPEKDRTYEVGGKTQIAGALSLTAAVFDTEMTNARITDPLQPTLQALSGTEKVKGAELGMQGYVTREWEIVAGYTYLDASAVGLAGAGIHGPIPNTARHQANLWTTYDLPLGVEVGTGINYIGQRQAGTDTGTVPGLVSIPTVPGYITWDAMLAYRFNDFCRLQVNGYNLTNKYYFFNSYFTRPNENHTVPGAGRTFLLTANFGL